MRILQVCAVDFTAFHLLRPLMHACRDDGWTVEFACADGPGAAELRAEGFVHRRVPMTRSASPLRQLRAALSLAGSLRAQPVDLVHTHTPAGGIAGRLAAMLTGHRRVVHTFHGLPFRDGRLPPTERAFLALERVVAARTTFFFSQAAGDVDRAARLGIARPTDTLVIGNGVDLRRFAPDPVTRAEMRRALELPEEAVVAATVSRLVREKGLLELADAAFRLRALDRLHFLVIGRALPSDRTDVSAALDTHPAAAALGPRWRRLGYRADADRILKAADLFVLPSYREGLPRSVIEAMATGLPVIASDILACRELVDDKGTGLLVPPREAAALADALGELATSAETRKRMGARARELAVERHDERLVLRRQVDVFRRLLAS